MAIHRKIITARVNYPTLPMWLVAVRDLWIRTEPLAGWHSFTGGGRLFIIPFLATIHSLVSEEGLRCVSLFLAENMPLISVCFREQPSLTALLFR